MSPLADSANVHAIPFHVPATLEALTALRDDAFVTAAYRVVLGRDPDPNGLNDGVQRLRSGLSDKVDILGDLSFSPEGRQRAVDIPGLRWRYLVRRAGRLPGIGWVVRWLLVAARLPALTHIAQRQQSAIEHASVVAEEHAAAIRARSQTAELLGARVDALERLRDEVNGLREKVAAAETAFELRHQHLSAANARLTQQLRALTVSLPEARPTQPLTSALPTAAAAGAVPSGLDDFYVEFEDRFRGSREETKRRHEVYLRYVAAAEAGTHLAPVLDVGCGRGEWLELLREHGCLARGIDVNRAMIAENTARGLDVIEHDVLGYLAGQPDASLGMVTGFHIIEHLPFEVMVRLFDQCLRVLRSGGCAIFETPNPENLIVGAYTFYFDPTHRHPLPPQTVEFVVRQRGFRDAEILRLHPRSEAGADDVLLDKWFRQATDYAVIAWKDRMPAAG